MYVTNTGYATVGDLAAAAAKKPSAQALKPKLLLKKPVKKVVTKQPVKKVVSAVKTLQPTKVALKKSLVCTITSHKRPEPSRVAPKQMTPTGLVSWRTATLAPSTGATALAVGPRPDVIAAGASSRWEAAAYFNKMGKKLVPQIPVPSMSYCAVNNPAKYKQTMGDLADEPVVPVESETAKAVKPMLAIMVVLAYVNLAVQAIRLFGERV